MDLQKREIPRVRKKRRPGWRLGCVPGTRRPGLGGSGVLVGGALPSVSAAAKVTDLLGHGVPREWELEWRPATERSPYGEA